MSISDEDLRGLLTEAAPVPAVRERDALLDSLVSRVQAGGVDVAEAPAPAPVLTAVASHETAEVLSRPATRRWGRLGAAAASVSVAGWVAIGVGSAAAAAAGAWMITHGFDGGGADADEPLVIEHAAEDEDESTLGDVALGANPLPTTAPLAPWADRASAATDSDGVDTTTGLAGDGSGEQSSGGADASAPRTEGNDDSAAPQNAGAGTASEPPRRDGTPDASGTEDAGSAGSGTDDSTANDTGDAAVEAEVTAPVVGGAVEDTTDAVGEVLDRVSEGVKDTTEGLEDTVVDVVPEGPLRDTVKPVIDAVNVSGLVAWLLDSLLCATDSAVSVTASDNVGVEDVTLAIGVAGSTLVEVDLAPSGGNTWTGAVSPLSALDLGLLNRVVSVEVTAVDAAGNTATTVTQKTVEILSCLG